jgi:methionyl aminopeptidase
MNDTPQAVQTVVAHPSSTSSGRYNDHRSSLTSQRLAGLIIRRLFKYIKPFMISGVSPITIDAICQSFIESNGGVCATIGYNNYPAATCISVNNEICHVVPTRNRLFSNGDIVTVDVVVSVDGQHCDAAYTYPIGTISPERTKLLKVTRDALRSAIDIARPGLPISHLSKVIYDTLRRHGHSPIDALGGHYIGSSIHMLPYIPNKPTAHVEGSVKSILRVGDTNAPRLSVGDTLCIEPLVTNSKRTDTVLGANGIDILTADGSDAAHFEHTILITETGCEVLT